ncbi:hypothetical protein V6N13_035701 [Hibiscus sabdariffa]
MKVEVNGEKSFLKVSYAAFEDEHRWIDGWKTNGDQGNYLSDELDSLGSSRLGKEPVATPEMLEKESKLLADINSCGLRGTTVACTSLGDGGPRGEREQLNREFAGDMTGKLIRCNMEQDLELSNSSDRPNGNHLFEVQVEEGAESYSSSGHSVAIEPVLDPFSVKPRLVTRLKNNTLMGWCSSLMNRPCRAGFSPLKGSVVDTVQGVEVRETRPEDKMGKVDGGSDKFSDEAKASLEICENIGLIFNEEREVILNRFAEMEKAGGR